MEALKSSKIPLSLDSVKHGQGEIHSLVFLVALQLHFVSWPSQVLGLDRVHHKVHMQAWFHIAFLAAYTSDGYVVVVSAPIFDDGGLADASPAELKRRDKSIPHQSMRRANSVKGNNR